MSHTDKTRPTWVRAAEKPNISCTPSHDHRNGECDLPADPARSLCRKNRNAIKTQCMWWPAEGAAWGKGSGCCSWCADQDGRKAKRRRERYDTRRTLHNARTEDE